METNQSKYLYVFSFKNDLGSFYKIQGDTLSSFTKKDCEFRIKVLYKAGEINKETRDYLLKSLKELKRV